MRTDRTCWESVEFSLWCSLCSHTRDVGVLQHEERSFGGSVFSYHHFPHVVIESEGCCAQIADHLVKTCQKWAVVGEVVCVLGQSPWRASIWRARWCAYGRVACDDVMPRAHCSAMRQDAMTSTPFTCTMLDNASMNCLMILRLRPFCMRLGMPFVAQETSTVTPCW